MTSSHFGTELRGSIMRTTVLGFLLLCVLCKLAGGHDLNESHLNIDNVPEGFDPAAIVIIGNDTYYISPAGSHSNIEALRFCADVGMVLISFETIEKYEMIKQHLFTAGSGSMEFWTSGRRWKDDGWVWTSIGREFTFANWYSSSGEPDFKGDNDPCVTFIPQNGWYDEPQPYTCSFICQMPQ